MYRRVVAAKLYIDNHFAENMDLNRISNEACFSKYHFLRLFKKAYGKSPRQYLQAVRITHAKQLLAKGVPPHQVCLQIGFQSLPSFHHLFKRLTGIAPGAYQQSCIKREQMFRAKPLALVPSCFAESFGWRK